MEAYRGQICPILMESFTETAANCTNAIGLMPETTDRFTILVQVGRQMNSISHAVDGILKDGRAICEMVGSNEFLDLLPLGLICFLYRIPCRYVRARVCGSA